MSVSRNSLYDNPFTRYFTGMRYATSEALYNVPYITYNRYHFQMTATVQYTVLVAENTIVIHADPDPDPGEPFEYNVEFCGWKIDTLNLGNGIFGYEIPESHYSQERIIIWPEDTAIFHYKDIEIRSSGISMQEFGDKIAPYVALAYTESALDSL